MFPELTVVDGLVLRGDRIVVPNTLQDKIVNIAHEGHLGITDQEFVKKQGLVSKDG